MTDTNSDCAQVLAATRRWLEQMVVGEGLCPFAGQPLRGGRVRMVCSAATDADDIYRDFLVELETFLSLDPAEDETGLFVLANGLGDFDDYLDMLGVIEAAIAQTGLAGTIQIASFHPDYRFEGTEPDDPTNYTNRAPWPVFHLIREAGLEKALASFPNPEAIPARNMARMREIGLAELHRRLAALQQNDKGESA